ncbi:hypothetical protein FNJ87_13470 [Nonlabens mediterrranea]|uniref:Uncharacterized protein n=1 Tax=Nonlabens mediterrranea TaxID=1419947 RepID=A0ABS0A3F6_9FLAO|nr:hypothetical protein [Nonlabens mediterrranea]MBF4985296.1 hypothetical protein [Nonlabens mediterrranea]
MKNYISISLLTGFIIISIATLFSYNIHLNQMEFIGTESEWKYDYSKIGFIIFLIMLVLNILGIGFFYFMKKKID